MRRYIVGGFAVAVAALVTPSLASIPTAPPAGATARGAVSLLIPGSHGFRPEPLPANRDTLVGSQQMLVPIPGGAIAMTRAALSPGNLDVEKALAAVELSAARPTLRGERSRRVGSNST